MCCGGDDDVATSERHRAGRHVVLAAQYNRAFDDSAAPAAAPAPAGDKRPTDDAAPSPESTKQNGVVAAAETSTSTDDRASQHAERDATGASADEDDPELLQDGSGGPNSPDAAADDVNAENANRAQNEKMNVDEATTIDEGDKTDGTVSEHSSADANRAADSGNDDPASSASTGNENSSSATRKEMVEPDSQLNADGEATSAETSSSAVTDDSVTDAPLEAEVEFKQVALPEVENSSRTRTTPVGRRWRSMGAGSRQRRVMIDVPTCDKAVVVHEDDLDVQPEPETENRNLVIETEDEVDAATSEDRLPLEEGEVKEEHSGEESKTEGRTSVGEATVRSSLMMGNIVLDLDELGLVVPQDTKQEEVSDVYSSFFVEIKS